MGSIARTFLIFPTEVATNLSGTRRGILRVLFAAQEQEEADDNDEEGSVDEPPVRPNGRYDPACSRFSSPAIVSPCVPVLVVAHQRFVHLGIGQRFIRFVYDRHRLVGSLLGLHLDLVLC